jgi:hypothetical protein
LACKTAGVPILTDGVENQPEWNQGFFYEITGLFGSFFCRTENDKVVTVADQLSESLAFVSPNLIEDT